MSVITKVRVLRAMAKAAGIRIDVSRGKGSHEYWIREGVKAFPFACHGGSECSPGVARKALAFIAGDYHKAFNGKV